MFRLTDSLSLYHIHYYKFFIKLEYLLFNSIWNGWTISYKKVKETENTAFFFHVLFEHSWQTRNDLKLCLNIILYLLVEKYLLNHYLVIRLFLKSYRKYRLKVSVVVVTCKSRVVVLEGNSIPDKFGKNLKWHSFILQLKKTFNAISKPQLEFLNGKFEGIWVNGVSKISFSYKCTWKLPYQCPIVFRSLSRIEIIF